MNLFLDTSVLLAACGSSRGASRELFRLAEPNSWTLIVTPYVLAEVEANLDKLDDAAVTVWASLISHLRVRDDVLTADRIAIFETGKDRPVLFGALAWAHVLLTLDANDFGGLLGGTFYALYVDRPGRFLVRERDAGRLTPAAATSSP